MKLRRAAAWAPNVAVSPESVACPSKEPDDGGQGLATFAVPCATMIARAARGAPGGYAARRTPAMPLGAERRAAFTLPIMKPEVCAHARVDHGERAQIDGLA
jgi:hypothetical protein